ncbi:13857_t:CDS:2, partial [Funneliformis caledonium]
TPVVHIADIFKATPRQFFEQFMPVDFIMSVVIPSTNKSARECERGWSNLTWMEFMRFIGILTIMTYVKCANICDYWFIKQETAGVSLAFSQYMSHQRFRNIIKYLTLTDISANDDPFHFARQFHDELTKILQKLSYLVLTFAWMNQCANRWAKLIKFGSTDTCITLYNHGLYSILQIKKCCYWPKNIPSDIIDVLGDTYGLFVSQISKINNVDLTVCSIRDCKDIVLLASYSTTILRIEVNRYIKDYGNAIFCRPVIFDEYNEFRSAVDILNNL